MSAEYECKIVPTRPDISMANDGAQPLYSWLDFHDDARNLIAQIRESDVTFERIVAIPRGGLVLGVVLSHALSIPLVVRDYPDPKDPPATLVVDDNAITGESLKRFDRGRFGYAVLVKHPDAATLAPFFYARESDEVFLFPWEVEAAHEPYDLVDVVMHNADETEE